MRGVHVAVDVEFQRRVDSNDAQAADDLGRVADFLRTQHDAFAIVVDIGQDLVVHGFGHRDGRGRREGEFALVQQFDGAVLQHFGVHRQIIEVRRLEAVQHGVGDGADTSLQRQQRVGQAARVHLSAQERIDMAGDGVGVVVRRQGVGGAVGLGWPMRWSPDTRPIG
ncbi:hypothetical protein G6F31_017773 [Rhizopus arrhizus]|nr:hypothetical protein G6F31_017773 [Rhizopus arrhizus]